MLDGVLTYIKSFLVLFLLIKVLLFLIPKTTFSKYISFFSGVILVIGIMHPVLQLLELDEVWIRKIYDTTFEKQVLEVSLNADHLYKENSEFYNQYLKSFVESEIKEQMQAMGMEIEEVMVDFTEDSQVKGIVLVIAEENKEVHSILVEKLQTEYQLTEEQCEIVYE